MSFELTSSKMGQFLARREPSYQFTNECVKASSRLKPFSFTAPPILLKFPTSSIAFICLHHFEAPAHLINSKTTTTIKMSDTSWDALSTRSLAPTATKVRATIKFGGDSSIIVPVDSSTKFSELQIEAVRRAHFASKVTFPCTASM